MSQILEEPVIPEEDFSPPEETKPVPEEEGQQALDPIPWEEEIADAFGNDEGAIAEPMPSFEVETTAPVKKRPKLALIIGCCLPLVGFGLFWGGISFVQALGSIVEESRRAKPKVASPDDPWQLEAAQLRQRLNAKEQRNQIEGFNAQAKAKQQTKVPKKVPSPAPKPSPRPPSPRRVVAPRVVYRPAPPAPRPKPKPVSRPAPPPPKPKPKPQPRPKPVARPQTVRRPQPQVSAVEQWEKLAQLNTMGNNGSSGQNLDFEIDETGVYQYDETPQATEEPSRFPAGLTAEAKLTDSLSFKGVSSLPATLELVSSLGDIPKGTKLSATATVREGVVTFAVQGYDNLFGYEAISDAQIMASVPAKLKGSGNGSSLLGDILSIGSEVLNEGTGQSIEFDGNGRISSVETATNNNLIDRAIGTGAEVVSKRLKQSAGRKMPYFKVKKGETVTLSVLGG